ncbi:MAG TPA: FAD-dependent oxidoreductase [Nakamurella sp.]|nr:FAD-dependent oxidoreductase [Nakamurella sp.]
MTRSILISGAGIAGSTVAYWLARTGWEVTVVEKAGGSRSSGNPVDVRGEATAVARAMGIWPVLQQQATHTARLAFVDARGRTRAMVATRRGPDPEAEVEVARSDLAAALLDAAAADAEIRFDDAISGLRQHHDGVDVEFLAGAPRRFDLVLGADGLHSNVRRLVFGPESAYARPFGMFVGTVRTGIRPDDPHTVLMYNEPGASFSLHPSGGDPLAAFIFRSRQHYDHRDPGAPARILLGAYANAGWIVPQVLDQWRAATDVYFDAVTRITLPRWSTGRVALLGDAADCLSLLGDGSSNAIVAAKTLADALAAQPADHAAAFAAYEARHRTRLRRYQRGARIASHFLVPATRPGIALRNTGARLVSRWDRAPADPVTAS